MNDATPFLDSTDVISDGSEMHLRMQRDGYLFVRGLLPTELLDSLRLKFLTIARNAGWVEKGRPLTEAFANLDSFCVEPNSDYMSIYGEMYKLQEFHALQHHPNLLGLLQRMCGETVIPHPRIIGRTIFPQRETYTTPAHQDFIPIQGTAETYTAWFPLHDLPHEMGGLQVAEGSHKKGVYDFRPALGAGGMEVLDLLEGLWRTNTFARGDVLFFHSLCVHKGVVNSGTSLRQSIDARYQRCNEPIDSKSFLPHISPVTWEEIYHDWPNENYKYYWHDLNMQLSDYDFSYHQERDRLAFEMADVGDERSRSTLQRIVTRDTDLEKRQRAKEALQKLEATVQRQRVMGDSQ